MIQIPFAAAMLLVSFLWILVRAAVCINQKHISWKREAQLMLVYICIVVVMRFTFFPFSKVGGRIQPLLFDAAAMFPPRINLIPFVNLLDYDSKRDLLLNLIGNTAMFIPTGIMTPLIYKKRNSFGKTVLTGFLMSLTIEIIQLPFAVRASDVDDLILNTLGCAIGYGILSLCRLCKRKAL